MATTVLGERRRRSSTCRPTSSSTPPTARRPSGGASRRPTARTAARPPASASSNWITEVFGRSDTTVAVLSAVPVTGEPDPLSAEVMARARDELAARVRRGAGAGAGPRRPQRGRPGRRARRPWRTRPPATRWLAWKAYTHAGPPWRLDDADPRAPRSARRSCPRSTSWASPSCACTRGCPAGTRSPRRPTSGPRPRPGPDLRVLRLPLGLRVGVDRGPVRPGRAGRGHRPAGGQPGATPGSARAATCTPSWARRGARSWPRPTRPRTCWASCWSRSARTTSCGGPTRSGTARPRTRSRRSARSRSARSCRRRYGYPELTDEVKAKILWRNAAALYGVDPASMPCRLDAAAAPAARAAGRPHRTFGPRTWAAARRLFAAEHPWAG